MPRINTIFIQRSIADILEEKGLTWKSYQENYPADGACHTDKIIGGAHSYARKHNPVRQPYDPLLPFSNFFTTMWPSKSSCHL